MDQFVSAVTSAADPIISVGKAIASGNWLDALLSIIMETEAFAKAMEFLGAVLDPVIELFDAVLLPVIEAIISIWNFVLDKLASISIFGWRPFERLTEAKVETGRDKDRGGGGGSRGGRQISEITGPTRDLLTDLLSPLTHLAQIVAPIQDIRQILYERLPNFNNMEFAGAGAMVGTTVVFESGAIVVNAPGASSEEITRRMMDQIDRELGRRIAFGQRGRGGRW